MFKRASIGAVPILRDFSLFIPQVGTVAEQGPER
jgi:hypothetical protein